MAGRGDAARFNAARRGQLGPLHGGCGRRRRYRSARDEVPLMCVSLTPATLRRSRPDHTGRAARPERARRRRDGVQKVGGRTVLEVPGVGKLS